MKRIVTWCMLSFMFAFPLKGQQIDTTAIFSLDRYLEWVRNYHPVMLQSALLDKQADATLLEARGQFDPKWFGDYENKSFDEKNYFQIGEAGLKIPTWWGTDIKLGYLWSNGNYLNPENNLPINGQAVIGVEVPLLQGLVFDQRRAQVRQARLFKEANAAEQRILINNLLFEAIEAYWQWAFQYQALSVYRNSVELAEIRLQNIRESFYQGDLPAIDTLESLIQVQDRRLILNQAQLDYENARLYLSNFLWYENMTPLELTAALKPEPLEWTDDNLEQALLRHNLMNLATQHPDLQKLDIKLSQLEIKERLKREFFKPQINFSYNFLGDGFDFSPKDRETNYFNDLLTENYKWEVSLSYPLFLRKERAGLQLVKLEQLETGLKFQNKQLEVANKIAVVQQQIQAATEQLVFQQAMLENYQTLLFAENEKFRIGESSIFLLNSREQKLIDSNLKLIKLQSTLQKLRWKLEWTKGTLQ